RRAEGARARRRRGVRRPRLRLRARGRRRARRRPCARAAARRARARARAARLHLAGPGHTQPRRARPPLSSRALTGSGYALNFYSPVVADQLRTGRKSATIRLGDKSGKYKKGMIVTVLCG